MTPSAIRALVDVELRDEFQGDRSRAGSHEVDLDRCLLPLPELRTYYLEPILSDRTVQLWLVLEEDPELHNGYEIVFDESKGMFGLGHGGARPDFVGLYGSFIDALEAM